MSPLPLYFLSSSQLLELSLAGDSAAVTIIRRLVRGPDMSKPFLLGVILLLVAVGYQYREVLQALLPDSQQPTIERNTKSSSQKASNKQPPSTEAGPNIKNFPDPQYYNPPFDPEHPSEPIYTKSGARLITLNELSAHGHNGTLRPLWLAVMGRVFDVEKGEEYYGPGGGYNFFTGRDGSRGYITGEFNEEGLIDDIEGLSLAQIGELDGWVKFYDKDYTFVGKLIARYYNKDGSPTKEWYKYQRSLADKEKLDAETAKLKLRFPGCNSHWTQDAGGKVFCSTGSGGTQRDWVGYPRRYFAPGSKTWRCACVHDNDLNSVHVKMYPLCEPVSVECRVYPDEIAKLRKTGG